MNVNTCNFVDQSTDPNNQHPEQSQQHPPLEDVLLEELRSRLGNISRSARAVANRIATEVRRVCKKSARIQNSGEIRAHQLYLAHHRLNKCLAYYKLGSQQGRVELHSNLSVMIYRHIAPNKARLGFSGRYNLIEDFLQDFYVESLKAFRRETEVSEDYQPRTHLEL
ncbi:MAG: hypothetical protein F6K03_04705, partial [Kamptonema sp. SIO4C4]|nr:hypothetical protein [Kamptonema sp. SIO4C4]